MTTAKDVLKMIKDNDVKFVDFRFTDPRGKWQHVTLDISTIEDDTFAEGIMFDGSSIAGWKAIHEFDMNLMPDPASACIDPFFAETTLILVCDMLEPTTGEPYNRDPRSIAKKAEGLVKAWGIGDTVFFGPEAEFFVFDDVRYKADPYNTGFRLNSVELPTNTDTPYEGGNLGHHIGTKKGYFPVPPQDSAQDMRSEMLGAMKRMGCTVEKHHHEVGSAQHELGMKFAPMVLMADRHADLQVLHPPGRQDLRQDRDLHAQADLRRQRLRHALPPVDLEGRQAAVRRQQVRRPVRHVPALHRRHHQARAHDQRLHQPDHQLLQAAGAGLRGAGAARLFGAQPLGLAAASRSPPRPRRKRVEVRFPDPLCNPYLGFAAMLMAGLDGIKNKLDPGEPIDKDLYDLPPKELKKIPTVCGSLREALGYLDKDRAFLKAGDVFDDDFIDSYIELKMTEVIRFEHTPHPVEFDMYYSG